MRTNAWLAVAFFFLAFSFSNIAHAQEAEDIPTDTSAFRSAYSLSYCFDACGDPEVGEVYRKAILEKFRYCPFSVDAKKAFVDWAQEEREMVADQLREYMEQKGRLPDKFCGTKDTCQERQQTKVYKNFVEQIMKYYEGEIGIGTLLPSPCDVAPGGL